MSADRDLQAWTTALRASHERLDNLVRRFDAQSLVQRSYCADWSVAQVLSHLGSGAEITMLMIDAALGGAPATSETLQEIWARWNAKAPQQQAADYQVADERVVARWEAFQPDEAQRYGGQLGPWELSASEAAGMRLSEHALHSWDVQVTLEPDATVPQDATALVLTRMGWMAGLVGKADRWRGDPVRPSVHVSDPDEWLLLDIGEKVELTGPGGHPEAASGAAGSGAGGRENESGQARDLGSGAVGGEVVMPAEALIRLIYGRLDPEHTPASVMVTGTGLDELREVFPGV